MAGGHADERVTGERRALCASAAELIAVDEIDRPGRGRRRRDHRVEAVLVHGDVEAFPASQPAALLERLQVFGGVETALGLRADEQLLTEEREIVAGVALVELDDVVERSHLRARRQPGQVRVHARLELVEQHGDLGGGERGAVEVGDLDGIDDDGAALAQDLDGLVGEGIRPRAVAKITVARNPDARAGQSGRLEILDVVRPHLAGARPRGGIARIDAGEGGQDRGRVGHGASKGSHRVLRRRDGNDARAAREPDGRLDPDHAVDARRADDRSVRLGSDRHRHEVRGDRDRRAGAGAAGRPVQHVRIPGLAAPGAPPARGRRRFEVRPLAHRRFAEDHGTGLPEPLRDGGVDTRPGANQRERPGGRLHLVRRGDVVLEEHGDSVEQAPGPAAAPLGVERPGDGERVRIDLLDRAQHRTGPVELLDSPQIDLHQRLGVELSGRHRHLKVDDGGFLDLEIHPGFADGGARAEQRRRAQPGREYPADSQEVSAGQARARSDVTHEVPPGSTCASWSR